MSLSEINNALIEALYKSFLFYIPQKVFEQKPELIGVFIEQRIVDTLVLVNSKGEGKIVHEHLCWLEVMKKVNLLADNKFLLIESKGKYDKEQFNHLFNSYNIQLRFYIHVSKWMYEHVDEQYFNITTDQKESLRTQLELFEAHFKEVHQLFGAKPLSLLKSNFNFSKFNKEYPDFIKNLKEKAKSKPLLPQEKSIKKTKKVLITDKEAELFLIEHVFSSNITN